MSEPLSGKVAFISRGTRGFGLASALKQAFASAFDAEVLKHFPGNLLCLPQSSLVPRHSLFVNADDAISG